jgi:uncharacterized protein (TIGR00730 family)
MDSSSGPENDGSDRIAAILASPTYREADRDLSFLDHGDTRGVRLQLDYLKAELLLAAAGIDDTIVVFGSTRLPEPERARREHAALAAALARNPNDSALARQVRIAARVLANSRYYQVARDLGALVGKLSPNSPGGRVVLMTGGGPGIMEAANRGAADVGAQSVGLNISLPREQRPNPFITPELCFQFHYFAIRKLHFLLRARALVAFPGGFGTLDELFEVLTLVQTDKIEPLPIVLVGQQFWEQAIDFEFLIAEGVIGSQDRELFAFAEDAETILGLIRAPHSARNAPLAQISPDIDR